jgi:hypothetical protein
VWRSLHIRYARLLGKLSNGPVHIFAFGEEAENAFALEQSRRTRVIAMQNISRVFFSEEKMAADRTTRVFSKTGFYLPSNISNCSSGSTPLSFPSLDRCGRFLIQII